MKINILFIILLIGNISCSNDSTSQGTDYFLRFEKISYYKYPVKIEDDPFQYRLTYYFDNNKPSRWLELDSQGLIITDYIYEYDNNWTQVGAKYREDKAKEFSIEKVGFENDSSMVTEWIDSLGKVYYTMKDYLNKQKKTYRAEFIGDKIHGYDSSFYTKEGFKKKSILHKHKGEYF